jgi:5-methyltetrahydrofolate--homocysteine methyltransferase
MELLKAMRENLYTGKADEVALLVRQALKEGLSPSEILSKGLIAGMDRVGQDFKEGVLFIPEVLVAARAMHAGMDILRPLLIEMEAKPIGRFVIGTVKGDLHDIGKKLVGMMMEGAGFEVIDLGIDTPAERFVEAVREEKPHILGISALLTTTMREMETTIRALEEAGLRDSVKIIVGGAPVTQDWADSIGADGYAPDAASAVDVAKGLIGEIEK